MSVSQASFLLRTRTPTQKLFLLGRPRKCNSWRLLIAAKGMLPGCSAPGSRHEGGLAVRIVLVQSVELRAKQQQCPSRRQKRCWLQALLLQKDYNTLKEGRPCTLPAVGKANGRAAEHPKHRAIRTRTKFFQTHSSSGLFAGLNVAAMAMIPPSLFFDTFDLLVLVPSLKNF